MSEWHWCADCDTGFCDTMWHYVTLWCLWQQNSETDVVSSCNSGMTVWLSVMSLAVAFIAETTGRASAASINRSVMITPQNIQLTCFLQNKNCINKIFPAWWLIKISNKPIQLCQHTKKNTKLIQLCKHRAFIEKYDDYHDPWIQVPPDHPQNMIIDYPHHQQGSLCPARQSMCE